MLLGSVTFSLSRSFQDIKAAGAGLRSTFLPEIQHTGCVSAVLPEQSINETQDKRA
jgi:hypothetical protein